MSQDTSQPLSRTPGLVLGGVVVLGAAAALSLPFPLLGGLLITPALLAAAITGYLNWPASRLIALSASAAALLIDLLSIVLIFAHPGSGFSPLAALHSFYGFICFLCALTGTTLLWLGHSRRSLAESDSGHLPSHPTPAGKFAPNLREDLGRVGVATAQGARHAAAAWRAYERLSEPRRRRAAVRAERQERRRAAERELRIRAQGAELSSEDKEIRKAQLRSAREVNSRYWF